LQLVRWEIVHIIDIIIEGLIVVLAAVLVYDLKMPLSRKAVVVIAFFFRLPYVHSPRGLPTESLLILIRLVAMAILRLHYLGRGIHSLNPTLGLVGAVVWAQIELHYSNVSGTIPCLRPFMMAVSTDYGTTDPRTAVGSKAHGSSSGSGNRKGSSFALNSMGSGNGRMNSENNPSMFLKARMGASRMTSTSSVFSRADRSNNKSVITSHEGAHDSNSIESNDSRRMIIKKEVDIRVERAAAGLGDEEMGNENQTNGHRGI